MPSEYAIDNFPSLQTQANFPEAITITGSAEWHNFRCSPKHQSTRKYSYYTPENNIPQSRVDDRYRGGPEESIYEELIQMFAELIAEMRANRAQPAPQSFQLNDR